MFDLAIPAAIGVSRGETDIPGRERGLIVVVLSLSMHVSGTVRSCLQLKSRRVCAYSACVVRMCY